MKKKIGVIDTNAGNLFSIFSCIESFGHEAILITAPRDDLDILLIPGQGRFGSVMKQLKTNKLDVYLSDWYLSNKPIIGICVGMQIFFEYSDEDKEIAGLGLIPGTVSKLGGAKTPMIGWAELSSLDLSLNGRDVYFVNSYGVKECSMGTSTTYYGEQFVASLQSKKLTAFQFHPEKSGIVGKEILSQCFQ